MYEFPTDSPVEVDLRVAAGRCDVSAEDGLETITVVVEPMAPANERSGQAADETTVELNGTQLLIKTPDTSGMGWLFGRRTPRLHITARIPAESRLDSKQASADLTCTGRLSALNVGSASGNVHVEHVTGDASIDTASGDVRLGRVEGGVKANCASGDLHVDHVGDGLSNTGASGDTTVGTCLGEVKVHSASGDLHIGSACSGTVKATTASGDVTVGVPAGTGVWLDLNTASGTTTSDLAVGGETPMSGHDLELRASSASGDIEVHRVPAA